MSDHDISLRLPSSSKRAANLRRTFADALEKSRERRANRSSPSPWIARKLAVGIVLALWCYAYYVYVGRLCFHMIRRRPHALGSRAMGISFLVIFNFFWLMFGWSYFKVILTPPGYAADHVHKSPRPMMVNSVERPSWDSDESPIGGPQYANPTSTQMVSTNMSPPSPQLSPVEVERTMSGELGGPPHPVDSSLGSRVSEPLPAPSANPKLLPVHPRPNTAERERLERARRFNIPPPSLSRQPPPHSTLLPEYRYCSREGFVKPYRAHHCRQCAKCVLKYDHHCPWIGQCVGARNQKFFIIFLFWSTLFTSWTFASLVASIASKSDFADGQEIAITAIAGLFTLFTIPLITTQLSLAVINATTVEHMNMRNMKDREKSVLGRIYSFWNFRGRRKTMNEWNQEWGRIETEGNIWWRGSAMANFESIMGRSRLGWILPIGQASDDGLCYPINPRFDASGRWRRRTEWPAELQ